MRRPRLHTPKPPTPKRGGYFRFIKYIIIAAVLGMIFRRIIPIFALFSVASNTGAIDTGYSENIFAGGIGKIGSPSSIYSYDNGSSYGSAEPDATPLIIAATKGDRQEVEKLLNGNILVNWRDGDRRTALMSAAYHGQNSTCKQLLAARANLYLKDKDGFNALDFATARGLVETVQLLLAESQSTDKNHYIEYAMLMQAAFASDIKLLPINHKGQDGNPSINRLSAEDKSPLHVAASGNSIEMISELINRGANADLSNASGQTPLHWAAWNNRTEIISQLLKNSAKINSADNAGVTPLMLAAEQGYKEAIILLMEKGADKNIHNKNGKNAAAIATNKGFSEIVAILQK